MDCFIPGGSVLKLEIISTSKTVNFRGAYKDTDGENPKAVHIITYQEGHLLYNKEHEKWDMRFFPVSANEFQSLRPNGADGVIVFTILTDGDTKLEMQQSVKVIGNGVRHK